MGFGGKPRTVKTPDELWELFEEYREWAKNNPWIKYEAIKYGERTGELISIPKERPLTEWEFATFIGMTRRGLMNYGISESMEEFFPTYHKIKDIMRAQRVSGGLVDHFNANLVARIDGIAEKREIDQTNHFPDGIDIRIV